MIHTSLHETRKAWAGFEDSHFLRHGLNIEIQIIQSQDANGIRPQSTSWPQGAPNELA